VLSCGLVAFRNFQAVSKSILCSLAVVLISFKNFLASGFSNQKIFNSSQGLSHLFSGAFSSSFSSLANAANLASKSFFSFSSSLAFLYNFLKLLGFFLEPSQEFSSSPCPS
jgi:hypothetical protein